MTEMLRTRYVFIDTQVFVRHGIQFERSVLKRLRELSSWGAINLILTDVVVREVESKIIEKVKASSSLINKFLRETEFMGELILDPVSSIKETLSEESLEKHGKSLWNGYINTSKATIVSSKSVDIPTLLSKYFTGTPPFSAKKKDEFPDAISMFSLESFTKEHKEGIYIISSDGDIEAWCNENPGFHHLKSLSDFIDLYNRTEEKLTHSVHEIFKIEKDWLLSVIEDEFKECEFSFRPDPDAYVGDVNVKNVEFHELSVLEVDEDQALLSIGLHIDFTAYVSGYDYSEAVWDSEEKEYAYVPSYKVTIEEGEYFEVTVEVRMDLEAKSFTQPNAILFDDSRTIEFGYDDSPYK